MYCELCTKHVSAIYGDDFIPLNLVVHIATSELSKVKQFAVVSIQLKEISN